MHRNAEKSKLLSKTSNKYGLRITAQKQIPNRTSAQNDTILYRQRIKNQSVNKFVCLLFILNSKCSFQNKIQKNPFWNNKLWHVLLISTKFYIYYVLCFEHETENINNGISIVVKWIVGVCLPEDRRRRLRVRCEGREGRRVPGATGPVRRTAAHRTPSSLGWCRTGTRSACSSVTHK